MVMMDDIELLRQYAHHNSQEAFAALVSRHLNLVYSVARRHISNPQQAEEITQAVFIILARKADSLHRGTTLSGWLYHTARLTAANHLRSEIRRTRREQEAYMQSLPTETESDPWTQIAPLLDEAMAGLSEKDRNAIVLRFFNGQPLKEVAAGLGTSEEAAKMRVGRAVEKLRRFFSQRGVILSATAIAGAVSAHSVQAAPVGLATTVTVAATKGAAVTASTLTLVKGTLNIMAWTKAKTAVVAGAAILLATGTTTVMVMKATASADPKWPKISRKLEKFQRMTTASTDPKSQLSAIAPAIDQVRVVNTNLPSLQAQAKMLVFSTFALRRVPDAANWCETLNANGKLWPTTPSNTVFALNARVAGRALRSLPSDTVVFFETPNPGWNQAGGSELLPTEDKGAVVAFADGRAVIVDPSGRATLRWVP
jgi:RNA polymerase sigma factor (sigma-70 family)